MRIASSLATLALLGALAPVAQAQDDDSDTVVVDDEEDEDAEPADASEDDKPTKSGKSGKAKKSGKNKASKPDDELEKQDLSGHALGTTKKENVFERDRFFVDKTDSAKTEKGTLIQGSLTSTSFGYHERGGAIDPAMAGVPSNSPYNRLFTDLRLQTDFRHIAAGRWDARVDVRARVVNDPGASTPSGVFVPASNSRVQSGLLGKNELELKELWLIRNGVRSDVFIGRQFIPDLGGVRIDGLRIDYASSRKFTLLGFGGLYPIRGSRSITSDYTPLRSNPAGDGSRSDAGRFSGAGGFGAAYRTAEAYGAIGGVALVPFSSESPRVYATSTGYWRSGPKLDFYHLAIVDLVGSNAVNTGLTNLSLGLNYKPDQRLRGTLALNRVDTETLNVQAQAFLLNPEPNINIVQNEAYLRRIATNQGRASLSAGLGELQRFEITAAVTYRHRGEVVLTAPPQVMGVTPATFTLGKAQSVEVYGAITDRQSIAGLRLGIDGSRIFRIGDNTFQRTTSLSLRAFAARELGNGHGEWEAEVAYSSNKDDNAGKTCSSADLLTCFGASESKVLSVGGNLFYRINRDWFAMGSAFVNRMSLTHIEMTGSTKDPTVTGLSGLFRIAYRF